MHSCKIYFDGLLSLTVSDSTYSIIPIKEYLQSQQDVPLLESMAVHQSINWETERLETPYTLSTSRWCLSTEDLTDPSIMRGVLACVSIASAYVGSFYLIPGEIQRLPRDHRKHVESPPTYPPPATS